MARTAKKFQELGLDSFLIEQLEKHAIYEPTDVQANCIPPILAGRDCMACAKTGSGKTLAFALPIIQQLVKFRFGIFALVLTPTRELADQIFQQFQAYGSSYNIQLCLITGGQDMVMEGLALSRLPEILIATPGRLADHIETGANEMLLENLKFLVLDEADQIFNGHFNDQLDIIFEGLPEKKQCLLFSATLNKQLKALRKVAKSNPFTWAFEDTVATVEKLEQRFILAPPLQHDVFLVQAVRKLKEISKNTSIIIFVSSCRICQYLSLALEELKFPNVCLHSMMKMQNRRENFAKFKSRKSLMLVTTDVGSRGLDIPNVDVVINHNVPMDPDNYIHRVGRTARAGNAGLAITLVGPSDVDMLQEIEKRIGTELKEQTLKESEANKISFSVNLAIRHAQITMREMEEFGLRKERYKRIKLLQKKKEKNKEQKKNKKTKEEQEKDLNKFLEKVKKKSLEQEKKLELKKKTKN